MFVWVPLFWFRVPPLCVGCASCGGPVLLLARAWRGACRLPCLRSLGFVMSLFSFASFVAALRAARASELSVSLWCAPGRSGLPCPGYFCAVSV